VAWRPEKRKPHRCRVVERPDQHERAHERFEVECDLCGWVTAADTLEEGDAIARLHEQFVAVLVDRWGIHREEE
jgi:hypothetical protein